jgi:hypothetical protein
MNKKDDEIAHPGMLSKPEKHLILAQFTNSPWTGSFLTCQQSIWQGFFGRLVCKGSEGCTVRAWLRIARFMVPGDFGKLV